MFKFSFINKIAAAHGNCEFMPTLMTSWVILTMQVTESNLYVDVYAE